jgi:ferredoxin-NADP reductase
VANKAAWRTATVVGIRDETATAKTFRLRLDEPSLHLAGQHYVVRLTAPDGYTASRSYSVASAPDGSAEFELTVERFADGEVSPFLHDVVEPGDELDVRGPIGGWFVWRADGPALLVGGGSGVVPLMAMLRLARQTGHTDLVRLVVSARSPETLYYAAELPGPETTIGYSRQAPADSQRPAGRLAPADIAPAVLSGATGYVCGSPGFADFASDLLMEVGVPAERIRVERFGPT